MRVGLIIIGVLLLAGCSAYQAAPGVQPQLDVRTAARGCLLGTADPTGILPIASIAYAPASFNAMDTCMAQRGWVRK